MNTLLGLLLALGSLLAAFVAATAFSLRSSDAAGNGLAEVYFAVAVIGLWLLIGVSLVIAATRPPRHATPWGAVNFATLLLFLGAVAGQLAALQLLSGHRSEGIYRLVVQVAVVAAPLAALLHIAWRGLGLAVPATIATGVAGVIVALASMAPVPGMLGKVLPPHAEAIDPVEQLSFPVIVLHNLSSLVVVDSAADLRIMHSNKVIMAQSEPFLIDSRLQIYVLRDLRLARGAGSLMFRGQGMEPVTFRLVDWEPDGTPEAALDILLRSRWFSSDSDEDARIREQLPKEKTLAGMIRVIRGEAR